jgi:predicted GNAT superfamily acetyltransferase
MRPTSGLRSRRMVKTWRVRLELARDDDGSLSDEAVDALAHLLTESQEEPVLSRGDDGTVLGSDDRRCRQRHGCEVCGGEHAAA